MKIQINVQKENELKRRSRRIMLKCELLRFYMYNLMQFGLELPTECVNKP